MALRARPIRPFVLLLAAPALAFALSGCLAQQADMKRLHDSLDKRIADLDQRDQALEDTILKAQARIEQQRKDAEHLFRVARARSKQDVRELREQEMADFRGKIEEAGAVLAHSQRRLDDLQQRLASLTDALATHRQETSQQRAAAGQGRQEALATLQADQQSLRREVARVQESLRAELDQLSAYVTALRPMLEGLLERVDRQLEEQGEAIAANAAATESLRIYLNQFHAALVSAIPSLRLPAEHKPSGITTAPSKHE